MPKNKTGSSKQTSVRTGNVSDVNGNVNIAGGNITTHHTVTGLSGADIKAEVEEIQSTVTKAARKNEMIDEGFLAQRFRNIARMAPDGLDTVVATLGNPLAGLGIAVKKIAKKAKEETSTQ